MLLRELRVLVAHLRRISGFGGLLHYLRKIRFWWPILRVIHVIPRFKRDRALNKTRVWVRTRAWVILKSFDEKYEIVTSTEADQMVRSIYSAEKYIETAQRVLGSKPNTFSLHLHYQRVIYLWFLLDLIPQPLKSNSSGVWYIKIYIEGQANLDLRLVIRQT